MNPIFIPSAHFNIGQAIFTNDYLLEIAKVTEFHKRTPRKIHACNLLAAICAECIDGSPSCNDLAINLDSNNAQQGPSRQAVCLRMNQHFENFIHRILEDVIACRLAGENIPQAQHPECVASFAGYRRVLVHDSTIIKLPLHLFPEFSGASNGTTQVCNARIQATYDLISGRLIDFSIDSYSKNDLKAAPELLLETGDLVLRDRGYLTFSEIQRHLDAGADCIYRHKTGTIYLDPETHQPIDLPLILRNCGGHLDITVLLNNAEQTPVRLVSAPVNQETANLRRMKAKKENKGHNPSKAVLELMNWTILITTISVVRANFKCLLAIYGLRWRIEVIFKAWKSHMNFDQLHQVSKCQMMILLKARLLLLSCCTNILYGPFNKIIQKKYERQISLLKLMKFLSATPTHFLRALQSLANDDILNQKFYETLLRYCCYDKRKRQNYTQTFEELA